MLSDGERWGGGGYIDSFTQINNMAYVYPLFPGSAFSRVFTREIDERYARALERGTISL